MLTFWSVLKWLHVSGAVVWLGGIFFVVVMLRPALAQVPEDHVRRFVLSRTVARMRRVMHVVIAAQVLTGAYMTWTRLSAWPAWWEHAWSWVLIAKIVLASLMISLYIVVPRLLLDKPAEGPGCAHGDGPGAQGGGPTPKQRLGHILHLVLLTLGFTVVFLAKMLV